MISDDIILTLLDDPDELTVASTMKLICQKYPNPNDFIKEHQDDEAPAIRRHLQQLACIMKRREARADFIRFFKEHALSLWDAMLNITIITDMCYNPESIQEVMDNFFNNVLPPLKKGCSTAQIQHAMWDALLGVSNGPDYFSFSRLLLSDVIESLKAHELLLCELARQYGRRYDWNATIVMSSGRFMLRTPENRILNPANDWKIESDIDCRQCHLCANDELIYTYLALLFTFAIQDKSLYHTHYIASILAELNGNSLNSLPYPLGTTNYTLKQ